MARRLLFVIDNLEIGGAEQVFAAIVRLFNNQIDFDVLIITDYEGEKIELPNNVRVIELHRKSKYNIINWLQLKSILSNYNVVHIHMRHTYLYLALVKKVFFLQNIFIFHDHYGKIGIDKSKPFKLARFFKPNLYIGVCNELCKWSVDIWGIDVEKVLFLQNLPNEKLLKNVQFNANDKNGKIVMVGNIKPIKNQLFALNIAKVMKVKIDFIGRNQDETYFQMLNKSLSGNLIIEDCSDVKVELVKYELGIFTSISESGPLVILEYLLSGLPFVCYKTGGISDILSKYYPDFFLETFNENAWIERIKYLMNNPPQISLELIKKIIDTEFNRENYYLKLKRLYSIE
jgi:glycosyltransferase involved in cell wall biosynthesis